MTSRRVAPLVYDVSRLCTRVLNATPNGIDRIDALLAGGLLSAGGSGASTLAFGWTGPRLLPAGEGLAAVRRAERVWCEGECAAAGDRALNDVVERLSRDRSRPRSVRPVSRHVVRRVGGVLASLGRFGIHRGRDPVRATPHGAVYVNASNFPLDWPRHTAWLAARRDVRLVMVVHDLLAIDHPEWFWEGEGARHRARLALLAARGGAAIVTSRAVEDRLRGEMARAGRGDLKIFRSPPPVSPLFHDRAARDPCLSAARYFVACGTIEPRKNYGLLLNVWRRLAAVLGRDAPKLVVVGKRGWLCHDILTEMDVLAASGHVIAAPGLSSAGYKMLLDHSLGLLAPSWAEGFGLPVAEALTSGVPVIASDIAPFREQGGGGLTLLDPAAEREWLTAITALSKADPGSAPTGGYMAVDAGAYLTEVRAFLDGL